jgi:hypothetical protein
MNEPEPQYLDEAILQRDLETWHYPEIRGERGERT